MRRPAGCNHEPGVLATGLSGVLKRRVGGNLGHLSNQRATLLGHCVDRLQHLVLSHLSEQNNTPDHALGWIHQAVEAGQERIRVAREQGFGWLDIH